MLKMQLISTFLLLVTPSIGWVLCKKGHWPVMPAFRGKPTFFKKPTQDVTWVGVLSVHEHLLLIMSARHFKPTVFKLPSHKLHHETAASKTIYLIPPVRIFVLPVFVFIAA